MRLDRSLILLDDAAHATRLAAVAFFGRLLRARLIFAHALLEGLQHCLRFGRGGWWLKGWKNAIVSLSGSVKSWRAAVLRYKAQ